MYILTLSHKSEKRVTERSKRLIFEVYLLTWELSSWFLLIE